MMTSQLAGIVVIDGATCDVERWTMSVTQEEGGTEDRYRIVIEARDEHGDPKIVSAILYKAKDSRP